MRGILGTLLVSPLLLSGCAGMIVTDGTDPHGFTFYDPMPHLLVTVSGDCTVKSEVVALPGRPRSLRLKNGYGSADLSATFANGLLTQVGQKTDAQVPEALTAITGLLPALGVKAANLAGPPAEATKPCTHNAEAHLYALKADGTPDTSVDKLAFSTKLAR